MSLGSLKHLSGKGKVKLLFDKTIWMCKQLYKSAKSHGARLIVPVQDGDRYIYMSIFYGNTLYYAKLGRSKVTADIREGTLDCCCCSRKRGCLHKAICKWYLYESNKLDIFLKNNGDAFFPTQTWETSEKEEKIGLCTTTIYPPQDVNLIEKMCEYLVQQKKIPLNYTCDAKNVPSDFVPTETLCYFCNVSLNTAVRISKVGRLLTMDAMVTGVQIYYKSCPNCQVCHRYQEYSDGVHNFNDTFLISIEVQYVIFYVAAYCNTFPLAVW